METQKESLKGNEAVINPALAGQVVSEADLCWTLGVDRRVLDSLRATKHFPCVYLNKTSRVYLVSEVTAWLKEHSTTR